MDRDRANWLIRVYDPSRIAIRYQLIADETLIAYVWKRSLEAALQAEPDGGIMRSGWEGGTASNLAFVAIERDTNGYVDVTIAWPTAGLATNGMDIFVCTNLLETDWEVACATNVDLATNWVDTSGDPLAAPGYPGTNHTVDITVGSVTVASQNVEIVALMLGTGASLTITNSRALTIDRGFNFTRPDAGTRPVCIADGTLNLLNAITNDLYDTTFTVGTNGNSGYLDLGATWGTTNGFADDFGLLAGVTIDVNQGGLRVDANSISMYASNQVETAGQEVTMRGDWLILAAYFNNTSPSILKSAGSFARSSAASSA